jgi:hypothetical protein
VRERSHRPDRKYAAIPNDAMRNTALSIEARGLLALLMTYSDHWEFNRDHLMQIAGMGKDRFGKVMGELVAAGYVRVVITRTTGGHFVGKTWVICDDRTDVREMPTSADVREMPTSADVRENRRPVKPSSGETAPIRIPTEKKTNRQEDQGALPLEADMGIPTSSERHAEKPKDDGFNRFWAVYPKKAGKADALKSWPKAITKADPETIILAATRYAETGEVKRGFAKNAQGWLNGERWNDEDLKPKRDTGYRPAPDWYGTH